MSVLEMVGYALGAVVVAGYFSWLVRVSRERL